MRIYNSIQGSDEWKKERSGHFTASKASDLLMSPNTKGYQNLINQIAYEKITGEPVESYKNEWMEYGNEMESIAREQYELLTFNKVHQIGFMELNEWAGASLDGIISTDKQIEIKCVKWNTQMEYLSSLEIPTNYYKQMQFQLFVSDRMSCDFFSYHPKLPPFLKSVNRDEKLISEIKEKLDIAINQVQTKINELRRI